MKATVCHNGTTAFGNIYGVTNTDGESTDLGTITFVYDSAVVYVKAVSSGGVTAATVQYSLAS